MNSGRNVPPWHQGDPDEARSFCKLGSALQERVVEGCQVTAFTAGLGCSGALHRCLSSPHTPLAAHLGLWQRLECKVEGGGESPS